MAGGHINEHSSPSKTPTQLSVVIVLCLIVAVFGIVMFALLGTGGLQLDRNSPAMSEEAVARRLKPVGEIVIGETGGQAQNATAAAKPAGGATDGKKTYDASCAMCHAAGVAGAPRMGDKAAWKPRIAQGKDVLYGSAIKGKNLMPPKGGAASVADADIKAAVDYLVSQGK